MRPTSPWADAMKAIATPASPRNGSPRVQWILQLLPQNAADLFAGLRDEGYDVTLTVSLITDHKENTFAVPAEVLRQVGPAGLDLELTSVSTKHIEISYRDVWRVGAVGAVSASCVRLSGDESASAPPLSERLGNTRLGM